MVNILQESLPPETELLILHFLNPVDLIKLRCVSMKLKYFIDEWNEKWTKEVANLSFFQITYMGLDDLCQNSSWLQTYCTIKQQRIPSYAEDFQILSESANFFGEELTLVKLPELREAVKDYRYMWCDFLQGCSSPQGDNYFVDLLIYKRGKTKSGLELPFKLNLETKNDDDDDEDGNVEGDNDDECDGSDDDEPDFTAQFHEFANAVVHREYAFELRDPLIFPNQVCRKIAADLINEPETISVIDIFLTDDNCVKTGGMICAGRNFLASAKLQKLLHQKFITNELEEKSRAMEEWEKKSTAYVVMDCLCRTRNANASFVIEQSVKGDKPIISLESDYYIPALLPDTISKEKEQKFMEDLYDSTEGKSEINKKQLCSYTDLLCPTISNIMNMVPCLENHKLTELGRLWHMEKLKKISQAIKKTKLMTPFDGNYFYEIALTDCDRLIDRYYDTGLSNDHQGSCSVAIVAKDAVMIVACHSDRC